MNIVDSSGWLAYFADEPNARHFLKPLRNTHKLFCVKKRLSIFEHCFIPPSI